MSMESALNLQSLETFVYTLFKFWSLICFDHDEFLIGTDHKNAWRSFLKPWVNYIKRNENSKGGKSSRRAYSFLFWCLCDRITKKMKALLVFKSEEMVYYYGSGLSLMVCCRILNKKNRNVREAHTNYARYVFQLWTETNLESEWCMRIFCNNESGMTVLRAFERINHFYYLREIDSMNIWVTSCREGPLSCKDAKQSISVFPVAQW